MNIMNRIKRVLTAFAVVAGFAVLATETPVGTITLNAVPDKDQVFAGWYLDHDRSNPYSGGGVDYRTAKISYLSSQVDALFPKFVSKEDDSQINILCEPADFYKPNDDIALPVVVLSHSLPTVSAAGMPAGIKFDAGTFTFTGKPTKPGETASVNITARNLTNTKGFTTNVTIKVGDATTDKLPLIHNDKNAYAALVPGKVQDMTTVFGAGVMQELATGGWTVSGLPAGMSFNSGTGTFSGVPTAANQSYLVTFKKGQDMATITLNTSDFPTLEVTPYLLEDGAVSAPVQIVDDEQLKKFKVTGAGKFAVGKQTTLTATAPAGYVFAGWFSDPGCSMAVENGNQDFRTATGFTYVIPEIATATTPVRLFALFIHESMDYARIYDNTASVIALTQGESMPADYVKQVLRSGSKPTVTVKGLPAGITFNATTLLLSGKATDKTAKWYDLVVTVKNVGGYSYTGIFGVSVNGGKPVADIDELGISGQLEWLDNLRVGDIVEDESSFGTSEDGVTDVTLSPAAPEIKIFKETEAGVTFFLVAEVNGEMPVVKTPGVFTATISGKKNGVTVKTTKRFIVRDTESLYERVLVAPGCETMGTVTGNGKVVHPGESFAINATPKSGYTFAGWYANPECSSCAWFMPEVADYRQANQTASTLSTLSFPWGEMVYFNPHVRYAKFIANGSDDTIAIVDPMNLESTYDLELLRAGSSEISLEIVSDTLPTVTFAGLPAWMDKDAYEHFDGFYLWYNEKSEPDPGEYAFTMTAKNVGGATATRKITIIVDNYQNPNLSLDYINGYTLVPGVAFNAETAMPGVNLVGWTVTGLPAGMTFDSKTGTFKGTPTTPDKSYTVWFKKVGEDTATVTMRTKPYPELVLEAEIVDPNETYPELGWAVPIPSMTQFKLTGAGNYQAGKEVTLGATAPADWVFAGWKDPTGTAIEMLPGGMHLDSRSNDTRVAAYKYRMTSADTVTLKGVFIHKIHDYLYCAGATEGKQFVLVPGYDAGDDHYNPMVGMCVRYMFMPLTMQGSFPTVTVSGGLPAGMKFDAKNLLLSGKITAPPGHYYVTFTGKNASGYTLSVPVRFIVNPVDGDPLVEDPNDIDTISESVKDVFELDYLGKELVQDNPFTVGYPDMTHNAMPWGESYPVPEYRYDFGISYSCFGVSSVSGLPAGMTIKQNRLGSSSSSSVEYYSEGYPTAAGWINFTVNVKEPDGKTSKFSKHIAVTDDPSRYVEFRTVHGKGSVTGSGVWNSGKLYDVKATPAAGYVFAGFFKDALCTQPAFNWTFGNACDYRAPSQKWTLAAVAEFPDRGLVPGPVLRYAKFVPESDAVAPSVTSLGFDPSFMTWDGTVAHVSGAFESSDLVFEIQPGEYVMGYSELEFPEFAFKVAADGIPTVTFSGLPKACAVKGPYADGIVIVDWSKFSGSAYPEPGDYPVTITVKSAGKTIVKTFTLRIGGYPSWYTTQMGLQSAYSLDVGATAADWNEALGLNDPNDYESVGYFTAGSDDYGGSWSWTVTGLPAGLTFNAQTGKITGTVSSTTGAKTYAVHFKRTTKYTSGSYSHSYSEEAIIPFTVNPLPSWAVGTFYGSASSIVEDDWEWPSGLEVQIVASGAVTATLVDSDGVRTTAKSSNLYKDDSGDGNFKFDFTAKFSDGSTSSGSCTISEAFITEETPFGYLAGTEKIASDKDGNGIGKWTAYQDAYTAKPAGVVLPTFAANDSTLTIPVSEYSTRFPDELGPIEGTLTLKFDADGAVTPTWNGDDKFTMVAAHMTPFLSSGAFVHAKLWVMGYNGTDDADFEALGIDIDLMIPVSASGATKASEVDATIETVVLGD